MLRSFSFNRFFFLRTGNDKLMALSVCFSLSLVAATFFYTGHLLFFFLVWNLLLACIPYGISCWLLQRPDWIVNRKLFIPSLLLWVAFIPNSFYILTDLFHLGTFAQLPSWFELIVILSFAWNGLLLGILSVSHVEKILRFETGSKTLLYFVFPVMFLNALGVYIGRYLRFNSWDFITDPFHLFRDIVLLIIHPLQHHFAWGMVVCFSVFMTIVYAMMKRVEIGN